jgi:fumarate hydratase subunit beta
MEQNLEINLDSNDDIKKLRESKIKTQIYISGKIFSARDKAHKRICELTESKNEIPLSLKNSIIYYMGPTPSRKGYPIGSCGPTSSYRMDDYLETTLKLGVIATIGKGERHKSIQKLIKGYRSPYLITIGGAGAYLANCIISAKVVLFDDLGTEAVRELIVKNFPVIVGIDIWGNSIFQT